MPFIRYTGVDLLKAYQQVYFVRPTQCLPFGILPKTYVIPTTRYTANYRLHDLSLVRSALTSLTFQLIY